MLLFLPNFLCQIHFEENIIATVCVFFFKPATVAGLIFTKGNERWVWAAVHRISTLESRIWIFFWLFAQIKTLSTSFAEKKTLGEVFYCCFPTRPVKYA